MQGTQWLVSSEHAGKHSTPQLPLSTANSCSLHFNKHRFTIWKKKKKHYNRNSIGTKQMRTPYTSERKRPRQGQTRGRYLNTRQQLARWVIKMYEKKYKENPGCYKAYRKHRNFRHPSRDCIPGHQEYQEKTEKMGGQRAYKELRQEVFVQLTFPGSTRHWTSKTATLIVINSSKCPKYRTAF